MYSSVCYNVPLHTAKIKDLIPAVIYLTERIYEHI